MQSSHEIIVLHIFAFHMTWEALLSPVAQDTINSRRHKPPARLWTNTECSMGIRVELEMLAVLLFLTPVVIDGVVLTKCQLVKDLQSAVPPTMPDRDAVIAKSEFKIIFVKAILAMIQ